jgi:hypothetical protein
MINPKIIVTPATGLVDGQQVTVTVTGFGIGGKVWLAECASPNDASVDGPGCAPPPLPSQPFLVTDDKRASAGAFIVQKRTGVTSEYANNLRPCAPTCVVVAVQGVGVNGADGDAYTPIYFRG